MAEGTPPPKHRFAKRTLFAFALFAGGNALFLVFEPDTDLGGKVIQFLFACLFELPTAAVGVYLEGRFRGWRGWRSVRRAGIASSPARSTPVVAFHYSGRRWPGPTAALLGMIVLLAFAYAIRDTPDPHLQPIAALSALLALVCIVGLAPATVLGVRRVTFDVDDAGARTRRWPRPFEVRWDQVGRIEMAKPQVPFMPLDDQSRLPRIYALRTREGFIAGTIVPTGELGAREGRRLEAALVGIAGAHGIPVVEVPYRDVRAWRKQRLAARV